MRKEMRGKRGEERMCVMGDGMRDVGWRDGSPSIYFLQYFRLFVFLFLLLFLLPSLFLLLFLLFLLHPPINSHFTRSSHPRPYSTSPYLFAFAFSFKTNQKKKNSPIIFHQSHPHLLAFLGCLQKKNLFYRG